MKYKQFLLLLSLVCATAYAVKRKAAELSPEIPTTTIILSRINNRLNNIVNWYFLADEEFDNVNPGVTIVNRTLKFRRVNAQTIRTYPVYFAPMTANDWEVTNQVMMLSTQIIRRADPQHPNSEIVEVTAGLVALDITQDPPVPLGIIYELPVATYIIPKDTIIDFWINIILEGENLEDSRLTVAPRTY